MQEDWVEEVVVVVEGSTAWLSKVVELVGEEGGGPPYRDRGLLLLLTAVALLVVAA